MSSILGRLSQHKSAIPWISQGDKNEKATLTWLPESTKNSRGTVIASLRTQDFPMMSTVHNDHMMSMENSSILIWLSWPERNWEINQVRYWIFWIWQNSSSQYNNHEKKETNLKTKRKHNLKEETGVVWTTAGVVCIFRHLWQQNVLYWPIKISHWLHECPRMSRGFCQVLITIVRFHFWAHKTGSNWKIQP
jgi:hypothetical protein